MIVWVILGLLSVYGRCLSKEQEECLAFSCSCHEVTDFAHSFALEIETGSDEGLM